MCTGQNHTLPHPVSCKGKDSNLEDAVLGFDGKFQESFFNYSPSSRENDAARRTKRQLRLMGYGRTGEKVKNPAQLFSYFGCFDLS